MANQTASSSILFERTDGVTAHQVVACDSHDRAALVCAGRCDASISGALEARAVKIAAGGCGCSGCCNAVDWKPAGKAVNGVWHIRLEGVPVGGPYRLEIRLAGGDAALCCVSPVLVGDLWILGGQSNMQGCGNMTGFPVPSPLVTVFAMNDKWRPAEEPIHRPQEARDYVHNPEVPDDAARQDLTADISQWLKGMGLCLMFALEVSQRTGRPIGLVPCARGGTSMDEWSPDLKAMAGRSLYGAMLRRFRAVGGNVKGMLWYQGESDTSTPELAQLFRGKFKRFVESVRADFDAPELPFYYVQIGRVACDWPEAPWNVIQMEQLKAECEIPNCDMVTAIDLQLDDLIHIGSEGQKILGKRLANLAMRGVYGQKGLDVGPRFAEVKQVNTPVGPQLRLRIEHANGRLVSAGRVEGFSLVTAEGAPYRTIYHQEFDPAEPNTIVLWLFFDPLSMPVAVPPGTQLWYGRTCLPYCNVVDEAGMALPVFGPIAL